MELDIAAHSLSEMMYLKRKQQQQQVDDQWTQYDTATSLFKDRQLVLTPYDPAEQIQVGSFYEIDHSKLPPKFPDQLSPIRLVMVHEKTRMRVSLRYPSIYSLRSYFKLSSYPVSDANYSSAYYKTRVKKLPALDEKYMIGSEVAGEALYKRVTTEEMSENKDSWNFWASVLPLSSVLPHEDDRSWQYDGIAIKDCQSSLLSALQRPGIIKWGRRRIVKFLTRHLHDDKSDHEIDGKEGGRHSSEDPNMEKSEKGKGKRERKLHSESDYEGRKNVNATDEMSSVFRNSKNGEIETTECCSPRFYKRKIQKLDTKTKAITFYDQRKKKRKGTSKKCIDRWSAERYNLAEVNMLKVMIEKTAFIGNPILRPDLRNAARKLIGDTGLLDHLLKHMAGKVAPCGEMRFRRRHNADGAMEYWLEKADLIDIRKEAGVLDPFWIPPPGWQLGDSPSQDPVCAREIKAIKEDIGQLKKDVELHVFKKKEEEMQLVTTPISSVTSHTVEPESFLIPLKEMYIELMNKKAKIEEQLSDISHSLCAMEEELERSKSERAAQTGTGNGEIVHWMQNENEESKPEMKQDTPEEHHRPFQTEPQPAEQAKAERLKSGFRICKPVGTFKWPNMVNSSSQVATPTTHCHHLNNQTTHSSTNFVATTTTRTATINLNDPPDFPNDMPTAEFPSEDECKQHEAGDEQSETMPNYEERPMGWTSSASPESACIQKGTPSWSAFKQSEGLNSIWD